MADNQMGLFSGKMVYFDTFVNVFTLKKGPWLEINGAFLENGVFFSAQK